MSKEEMIPLDGDMIDLLASWHGGQWTATYSLLSTGEGTQETIESASSELSQLLPKVDDDEDKEELEGLIDQLDHLAEHGDDD